MYEVNCRHFSGYKPCERNSVCSRACPHLDIPTESILIVHLGAMGAVLRSTALLSMIKQKHPKSLISWVTDDACLPLLQNNPMIDKIFGINARDQLRMQSQVYDVGYFIDKSTEIAGIQKLTSPKKIFGFKTNGRNSAILPATPSAWESWELGLNNDKKFYVNTKTELHVVAESLELLYSRNPYVYATTIEEKQKIASRRLEWSNGETKRLIGLNTGTSGFLPHKTIPFEKWQELIRSFRQFKNIQFVLLGGPAETQVNTRLAQEPNVVLSPTQLGLRDGACSIAATDIVVTGDSLGMHMGIAFKKYIIAWFGPSCAHEIDLYDLGVKLVSEKNCSPCWKRTCTENSNCSEEIDISKIKVEIEKWLDLGLIKENRREFEISI